MLSLRNLLRGEALGLDQVPASGLNLPNPTVCRAPYNFHIIGFIIRTCKKVGSGRLR